MGAGGGGKAMEGLSPASPMTARSCREEGREQGESRRRRLVHFVRQEAALKEFPVRLHIL